MRISFKALLFVGCATTAFPSGAYGQSQSASDLNQTAVAPQDSAQDAGIADIVVTAQRREQNLQDVPLSVTALDSAAIDQSGVGGTQQLQQAVPGLVSYQRSVAFVPYIRGVGSNQTGSGIESSVAVYLDGVYQGAKAGNVLDLANIERVEVLRGPQGTLYGRNATGGAINIITRAPSDRPELTASAGYGRFDEFTVSAYASTPITDTLGINASFNGRWDNGYVTNPQTGRVTNPVESVIGMVRLQWRPTADFTLNLSGSYSFVDDPTWVSPHLRAGTISIGQIPARGGAASYDDDGTILSIAQPVQTIEATRATATALYDFGPAELYSITGYVHTYSQSFVDLDATSANVAQLSIGQLSEQFSQELQLRSSRSGPLTWIVGGYYMWLKDGYGEGRQNLAIEAGVPAPFRPIDLTAAGTSVTGVTSFGYTNAASAFAQATYEFLPNTNLTAGLRYNWERKTVRGRNYRYGSVTATTGVQPPYDGVLIGDGRVFGTTPIGTVDVGTTFENFTWRLALDHRFNEQVMAYASYTRGFKSGAYAVSTINPALQPVEPETIDAFEVGLRTDLLNRRLRLNLSGYYYDYRDIQVSLVTGNGMSTYLNAARGSVLGLDVDVNAVITDRLNFTGAVTVLRTEYEDFPNALVYLPNIVGQACVAPPRSIGIAEARQIFGSTPSGGNCAYSLNATGQDLIFAPRLTINAGFDYSLPLAGGSRAMLTASVYHNSGFDVEAGGVGSHIDAFTTVNASASWFSRDDRFSIRIWGRNLTNSRYAIGLSSFSQSSQEFSARPVSFGITFGVRYGG